MRQRQTHPTLRYRPHAHCPACGSGWIRESPAGKARCGVCGKRLIRKSRRARAPRERRAEGLGGGVVPCAAPRSAFAHCTLEMMGEQA